MRITFRLAACTVPLVVGVLLAINVQCAKAEQDQDAALISRILTEEHPPPLHHDYPELVYRGSPLTSPQNFPLDLCQGGCQVNEDCRDDLECFLRGGLETVNGCSGTGEPGMNYCQRPIDTQTTTAPTTTPPDTTGVPTPFTTAAPTPVSTTTATTAQPATPAPTPVSTTAATTATPSTPAPTVPATTTLPTTAAPTATPPLTIVDDSQKPFDKCVGECNDDSDCRFGLLCQERGAFEFVPGCTGTPVEAVNYCYDPNDGVAPPTFPSGSFRLRLYWQDDYRWQESSEETFWCIQERGGNSAPVVKTCKSSSTQFEFVYLPGQGDQIKVRGSNKCLERTGNTAISFQDCNAGDEFQRWKGNWPGRRFDIRSVTREGCLSQHHHPKSNEEVFINPCDRAHLTDTGFWEIF